MSTLLFTSVDTLLAAFGFGMLAPGSASRKRVCCTFFAADGFATLLGVSFRNTWLGQTIPPITPFLLALYVLVVALVTFMAARKSVHVRTGLPWVASLLAVDNLIAAASGHIDSTSPWLLTGAIASGIAALMGLEAGGFFSAQLSKGWAKWVGATLLTLTIVLA